MAATPNNLCNVADGSLSDEQRKSEYARDLPKYICQGPEVLSWVLDKMENVQLR